ncbi:MAG: DUF4129 domain-containing transglutaminase family protein [Candidatus Dormibacteria bacterium]
MKLVYEDGVLSARVRRGAAGPELGRLRLDLTDGLVAYALLTILMVVTAGTVGASHWVSHTDVLGPLALVAMLVTIVLAKLDLRGTTFWLAVEAGAVPALFLATADRGGLDPAHAFAAWVVSISHSLELAALVCMAGATWLCAASVTFWTLRRRNFPFAMFPMATILGIEVINDPDQAGIYARVGAWIVAAMALALTLNLGRLRRRWRDLGNESLAWSVSVEGGRALVVVVLLAFVLPPLTNVDLSTRLFFNPTRATLALPGGGPGASRASGIIANDFARTGYTERVEPGGPLQRSHASVMEVSTDANHSVYWRGVDLYSQSSGAWLNQDPYAVPEGFGVNETISQQPYQARQDVHARIRVLGGGFNTVFWPGEPEHVGLVTAARGIPVSGSGFQGPRPLESVDAVYNLNGGISAGTQYDVVGSISVATDVQLRAAGNAYPASVQRLTSLDRGGISPRVVALARQLTVGASNDYDRARAIEAYLRHSLTYRLDVAAPPPGTDPVEYFLFTSRVGYCEYFASSMGELVRGLGIPVRLVNGYGPGVGDEEKKITTIRASDAHTWVEVFFPGYGWVPFEPTPDPTYPALDHTGSATIAPSSGASPAPRTLPPATLNPPVGNGHSGDVAIHINPLPIAVSVLVLVALYLLGRLLLGAPILVHPRTAWRRLRWLGRRVGVVASESETPLEFAGRLAVAVTALGPEIVVLGDGFSRACYARGGLAETQLQGVNEAWAVIRGSLLWRFLRPSARAPRSLHPGPASPHQGGRWNSGE